MPANRCLGLYQLARREANAIIARNEAQFEAPIAV
jgi:hypothetical protein